MSRRSVAGSRAGRPSPVAAAGNGAGARPKTSDRVGLRDVAFEKIRSLIVAGELEPGQRLIEESLGQQLGMSRNPVRESLKMLEREGFVTMEPFRGALVSRLNNDVVAAHGAGLDLRLLRQANAGPARARNAGAEAARAPLLAFTDEDPHIPFGFREGEGAEAGDKGPLLESSSPDARLAAEASVPGVGLVGEVDGGRHRLVVATPSRDLLRVTGELAGLLAQSAELVSVD